jgi:hypothetical protein
MNINTRPGSQEISLVNSTLLAGVIVLLCAVGALSYALFGRNSAHLKRPVSIAFELSQLQADTRTFFAGARWLLEPEPVASGPDFAANANLKPILSGLEPRNRLCLHFACASNCCRFFSTNPPAPG